jgi:RHS repeat-associated protein
MSQLVKVETKNKTTEYEYDNVGNRLQMKILTANDTNITNYEYNTDNQLLYYTVNGTDTVNFTYDANGNQIEKETANDTHYYSYNYDNNLLEITALNDTNVITYSYSSGLNRLSKTTNGQTIKYFYDGMNLLTEYDTTVSVICRFTNHLRIDDIISAKRNSTVEYYHKDALGSITDLTDNTEDISISYRYNEFGSIEYQSTPSHPNDFTYTGRQIDRESGLYYYRSRYYNSLTGRFIQKDKYYDELINDLINNEDISRDIIPLYLYVKNHSINYIDSLGKQKKDSWWIKKSWIFACFKTRIGVCEARFGTPCQANCGQYINCERNFEKCLKICSFNLINCNQSYKNCKGDPLFKMKTD